MAKEIKIQPGDKILISRSDKLGDLILALPFVENMKLRYPDCSIDVLTSLYASPIIENNDKINKIIRVQNDQMIKDPLYKKDLLQKIKKENYKIVVALFPERRISRLFHQAKIPIRVGTARRFVSVFFNQHIYHTRKENKKHECEYNLDFLHLFKKGELIKVPKVYLRDKEINNARRILGENNIENEFVILHPGSGGSAECWQLHKFIKLFELLKKSGISVIMTGSEVEGKRIEEEAAKLKIDIMSIAGDTDLRTLAAVLSLAELVVANSTGPLHLAAATDTKVLGLYPSNKIMSPVRWGPLGKGHKVIMPINTECNCPPKKCQCMETIDENQVAAEIIDMIKPKS